MERVRRQGIYVLFKVPTCDLCWLKDWEGFSQCLSQDCGLAPTYAHSFRNHSLCTEHLLCARHCPRHRGCRGDQECQGPCPHRAHIPVGDMQTWYMFHAHFNVYVVQVCAAWWGPTMLLCFLHNLPLSPHLPPASPSLTMKAPGRQMIPTPLSWGPAHSHFSRSLILPTARGNESSSGNLAAGTLGWDRQPRNNCLFECFIGMCTCFLLLVGTIPSQGHF